jgi:hypothetical protein
MKTPNGLTAAFVLASAVLAAPAASADALHERIDARFHFDPGAPAAEIYRDLTRTAERACELAGGGSRHLQRHERNCIAEMVRDGVNKLNRADVAAVHNGFFATANADARG